MNIPSDPHAPGPGLTPEERDFAQRLSRLGGQREPAPALDARILAAAHDAVQASASAAKRHRARRRWPVTLGVAASLALAVGIAWRLRPLPDAEIEYSEAPVAVQSATQAATANEPAASGADAASEADDGVDLRERVVTPRTIVMSPEPAKPAERKAKAEFMRDAAADTESKRFAAPEAESIVFDDPSPVDTPSPAPAPAAPPPPPPSAAMRPQAMPAPAAAAGAAANASQTDEARQSSARGALRRESNAAAEAEEASALDRIEVTGSRIDAFEDQPFDDQPPASADSPQVQQAWLQRIRELVARGKLDEARASLGEYQRRYPAQPLPDDLRALDE